MSEVLLLAAVTIQVFTCFFMTGIIWIVQLVHYPGFEFAAPHRFFDLHRFHSTRMTWIVLPIMTLELLSAGALALHYGPLGLLNFLGVLTLWLLTAGVSVPRHTKLAMGFDLKVCQSLVRTNWARTVVWTARSLVFILFLYRLLLQDLK